MPIFDFQAPDGRVHSVEGPDGATVAQAFQILQQSLGNNAPPPGYVLDKKPGLFDDIPSSPKFDAAGARRAGYTDAEIRGVQGALQAGYSPQEISDHLSKPRGMFSDIAPLAASSAPCKALGMTLSVILSPATSSSSQTAPGRILVRGAAILSRPRQCQKVLCSISSLMASWRMLPTS
jgi:hypothetical protein